MEKLTSLQFFDYQKSKEEDFKCFRRKLMQKLEEKDLNKSWKNWTASSARMLA